MRLASDRISAGVAADPTPLGTAPTHILSPTVSVELRPGQKQVPACASDRARRVIGTSVTIDTNDSPESSRTTKASSSRPPAQRDCATHFTDLFRFRFEGTLLAAND